MKRIVPCRCLLVLGALAWGVGSLGTAHFAEAPVTGDQRAAHPAEPGDDVRPESIVRKRYGMTPPHFSKDPSVKIDYDIVYVRAPHNTFIFPDVGAPTLVEPGADLMLLHPDGKEELLVEGGKRGG